MMNRPVFILNLNESRPELTPMQKAIGDFIAKSFEDHFKVVHEMQAMGWELTGHHIETEELTDHRGKVTAIVRTLRFSNGRCESTRTVRSEIIFGVD